MKNENNQGQITPEMLSELNRHYDTTLWVVTSIWVAAIGGLLVYSISSDKFDIWLSVFGLLLTNCAFFFLASFRSVNSRVQERMPEEMKDLFRTSPWFRQWNCFLVIFLSVLGMWLRLLIEKKPDLLCYWLFLGAISAAFIFTYWWKGKGRKSGNGA